MFNLGIIWNHLRSNLGIICCPIWDHLRCNVGSFTVPFGDYLLSNWGSFSVQFGAQLWSCTNSFRDVHFKVYCIRQFLVQCIKFPTLTHGIRYKGEKLLVTVSRGKQLWHCTLWREITSWQGKAIAYKLKNTYHRCAWTNQISCFLNRPRRGKNKCSAIPVLWCLCRVDQFVSDE